MKRLAILGFACVLAACQPTAQPTPEPETKTQTPAAAVEGTPPPSSDAPTEPTNVVEATPDNEVGMAVASSYALSQSCGYSDEEQTIVKANALKQYNLNEQTYAQHIETFGNEAQQSINDYRNQLEGDDWSIRCDNLKPFVVVKQ